MFKDEEHPIQSIHASSVTITLAEETANEEVNDKTEKQIHETTNANEENIDFATKKTTAPEGQIKLEKLKDSSANFASVHNSVSLRETTEFTAASATSASGVTDTSTVAPASDVRMLLQESEKLDEDSNLLFEDKIQETIDANEVKEMCIGRPEEVLCLSSTEHAEEGKIAENQLEDPQKESSNLVSEEQSHENIKVREVEEIEIATDEKPTHALGESETTEVSDSIPRELTNKTIITGESMDHAMEDAQILEIRKLVTGPNLVSDEKIHDNIPATGDIDSMILKDEECQNKKSESMFADEGLEKEILLNQGTEKPQEEKVTLQNIEAPKGVSDETSKDKLQTPDVISSKKATAEDRRLGEASEVEFGLKEAEHEAGQMETTMKEMGNAVEDSIEEIKASDSEKIQLSDLLQKSTQETLQTAEHFLQERSLVADDDSSQNKQVATVQVEEEKTYEEEDGDEEKDKHTKDESGSDAPVIVEASRDADLKPSHKKSHNILSGVGSKVKHSIAKVKKAIIGKSSHQKSASSK